MKTGCLFLCLEVRKSNVFEAVKQAVPTRQAAEFYGVQVGRNGMACCPFHDDKHPSMKVDRRFHCFGCQADGDVIDFTARLFGLSSKEAALKLAEDFSVRYDAKGHDPPRRKPVKRKISEELRYRQAEQKCFRVLCDYLHLLERWEKEYAPQTPEETSPHTPRRPFQARGSGPPRNSGYRIRPLRPDGRPRAARVPAAW